MPPWSFSELVLFLTAYSFVGWCFESLFCTIFIDKKWVNRGFLTGPVCPIYGVGAVGVLLVSLPLMHSPPLVFLVSLALTSTLEFFTSWLLEKLFDMRWWDYSHCMFNIQGRVCLKNALFFGVMGLSMAYGLHPPVERLIGRIPPEWQRVLASGVILLFAVDLLHTLGAIQTVRERIHSLRDYLTELERYNEEHTWFDRHDIPASIERLRALCAADTDNERAATILHTLDSLTGKRPRDWRIVHNARMQLEGMQVALEGLRGSWDARMDRERERAQGRWQRFVTRLREALTERSPRRSGLNLRKVILLFVLAGAAGCLLETIVNFAVTGVLESRQGVLYGPFNQVYGLGAVLVVWLLGPLREHGGRWVYLGGAVIGGAVQFLCSLVQELLFGAVSWQYDWLSIGGRTDLGHMLLWGLLALALIRAYPRLSALIDRIPRRQGVFLAGVLAVMLASNLLISAAAVGRWTDRQRGIPAQNAVERHLDARFPDPMLEEIFPNLALVDTQ